MKTSNFMRTLPLLVAIIDLSSCGDKCHSNDYLRNSDVKPCGKTWVNDSDKSDAGGWVRHALKFDDSERLAETYAYYHLNENQPYRTETNNPTWSWIDDSMEGIVSDYGVNGMTYFDGVWVHEHNLSGKLNGKVVVFVDSEYNRNQFRKGDKRMKGYLKILLTLLLAVGLASYENDQGEIEYVVAGRAWTGDVGMSTGNGEVLFSTFEFGLGGFGVEIQFYIPDGILYDQYHFRWYWGDSCNRSSVLDYGANGISLMDDVKVYGSRLSGIFYLPGNTSGSNFELRME